MSSPRRSAGVALALAAAFMQIALGACERSRDRENGRVRVRIGVRPLMTVAPIFIAKAESLYAEQGLDVELVMVPGVGSSIPLLLSGQIDVLPGPVSASLFNSITRGGRIRIVGDKGQYSADDCAQNVFVISSAYAKRGGAPRRIATMQETFNRMYVERVLRSKGFQPDDVEQIALPKPAEYEALVTGAVDGAAMSDPWLTKALKNGAVEWARINQVMPGYQYSVISYGPRLLDQVPDVGRRIAIANLKAMRLYNQGKTQRNLAILAAAMGFDPSELRDICWPRMREDGMIDTTSLLEFQRWSLKRGELDAVVPVGRFWDARFVESANRALQRAP
jgi:NitT/TauT family transport system substrate-binding protein